MIEKIHDQTANKKYDGLAIHIRYVKCLFSTLYIMYDLYDSFKYDSFYMIHEHFNFII